MRKLLAHAFSDTALLDQEPLLTYYFDLLVAKLKQRIDAPSEGRVDMKAYYNFTTFDIIGYLECLSLVQTSGLILSLGISLLVSPSGLWKTASIIRGSGASLVLSPVQARMANIVRNVFESIKILGILRFAAMYPIVSLVLNTLQTLPWLSAKRTAHLKFTGEKIEKRLREGTDRKDFISHVSALPTALLKIWLNHYFIFSVTMMKAV